MQYEMQIPILLDVFEIPMRYAPTDTISSTYVKAIRDSYGYNVEDYISGGRDIMFHEDVDIHKYKFYEREGADTVERIVITTEPMNPRTLLNDKKQPVRVYPIWTKKYSANGNITRMVYNNSIIELINKLEGIPNPNLVNINLKSFNALNYLAKRKRDFNSQDALNIMMHKFEPYIKHANMQDDVLAEEAYDNIHNLFTEMWIDNTLMGFKDFDYRFQELMPQVGNYPKDKLSVIGLCRDMGSDEFKPFTHPLYFGRYDYAPDWCTDPVFDIDENVIFDLPASRYEQRTLINYFNTLPYTDVSLTISGKDAHLLINYAVSRYVPPQVLDNTTIATTMENIKSTLIAIMVNNIFIIDACRIDLVKSWQDEVYITFTGTSGKVIKVYYDLVMHELCSYAISDETFSS